MATGGKEGVHHLRTAVTGLDIVADIEGDPGAEADDGQGLARGGNRFGMHGALLRYTARWANGGGRRAQQK